MLRDFRADLHVHTCLSPCASNEMFPSVIVMTAVERHLDIIGVCDHNSTENVEAVRRAADKEALTVIGGLEVTSREEVHVLGLFDSDHALRDMAGLVERHLPGRNDEGAFGEQLVVDDTDGVTATSERLLIGATELSIERIVDAIHARCGLAIASHVDREAFGIIGQLGLIPPGLRLDALELSPAAVSDRGRFCCDYDFPLLTSSDAHYPDDIGMSVTTFTMETVSIEEMRQALQGNNGRKITVV